ncbi:MAG: hypothetical protein H0V82_08705 [Candidatus Protochlamydia sp.]|nr:hypothetical protein [Candidatus Protochlamydia sp.]
MNNFLLCFKRLEIFLVFFLVLANYVFCSLQAFGEEDEITYQSPQKKNLKVLVLIIASDNTEAYLELQKVWKAYMHSCPEHIEVYFIKGNPDLPTSFEIRGDDLFVKTEEGYIPGIINKTILSMEAMLPRFKEFDFVLRTNLSSFYVFPRLLNFIRNLPPKKCYCGFQMHIPASWTPKLGFINFVSGAGFILSIDLVEMLIREKCYLLKYKCDLPDDVLIGLFFQKRSILSLPAERMDIGTLEEWNAQKDNISENAFHFRAKNHTNLRTAAESFSDELHINQELLKIFYQHP